MTQLRVLAAMSGGVDSAVAAARAADAGHQVTGVHLALSANPRSHRTGARGCCTLEDARDARRAADVIGIPFYVWDMAERFSQDVVADFVAEYAAGRTPNPCLRCNEKIKFTAVLDRAVALGFDAVCTGHHARLDGQRLRRSADPAKDQSYVLAVLTAGQLGRAMFPLGDSTKAQVRQEAADRGLAVADKPDSHDVCFIPDGDTRRFLAGRLGQAPGQIVDTGGRRRRRARGCLRVHHRAAQGAAHRPSRRRRPAPLRAGHRAGQRHGDGRPAGAARRAARSRPAARCGPAARPPRARSTAPSSCARTARRTRRPPGRKGTCSSIRLHEPARAVARGQAAVLYHDDLVLGSGTIHATHATAARPDPGLPAPRSALASAAPRRGDRCPPGSLGSAA